MTRETLRKAVLDALATVAPEMDPAALLPDEPLREQLDIDSFDLLQFIIALSQILSLTIPEDDYGRLTTLDSCLGYLEERLGAQHAGL